MKIKICQISVRDLIEWLSTGWADWAGSVGFGWTWPLDPKTKACRATPERAIGMILLHGESCNSSTTLPNMADGGKVYASRSYHGRLSASTAVARGSGTGDTNRGNLLLNLMAIKIKLKLFWAGATCCILSRRPLEGETTLFGWSGLAWIACLLPRSASLECVGLSVTCFLVHQVKSPYSGAQVGPTSCLLPCLCMTLLCCCRLLQVLSCLNSWNSFKARKTALSSR